MKRLLFLLACLPLPMVPNLAQAQSPLGTVVTTFPINAAKLLADPVRNQVYAAVTSNDSVVVFSTLTLQTTTIFLATGSQPVDLSLSPDNRTLYVANSGSSITAITAIDPDALAIQSSIKLPGAAQNVVAGLSNRLYVRLSNSSNLFQVDASNGTYQLPFGKYSSGIPLTVDPTGSTLYVDDYADNYYLTTFDVSTAIPTVKQTNGPYVGGGLYLSHNGKYFTVPNGTNSGVTSDSTTLYFTSDLTSNAGSFSSNRSPGPLSR